jgi:hypothetical protein
VGIHNQADGALRLTQRSGKCAAWTRAQAGMATHSGRGCVARPEGGFLAASVRLITPS